MLDLKYIVSNQEYLRKVIEHKWSNIDLDNFIELYTKKKSIQKEIDDINSQRKKAAEEKDIQLWKELKAQKEILEKELNFFIGEFMSLWKSIPNIYSEDTPIWKDDSENVILRSYWVKKQFSFKPKTHRELGEIHDIIDNQCWSKVSGSRFVYIKGKLAQLQFALVQYAMNTLSNSEILQWIIEEKWLNIKSTPFIPVVPPVIVKMESMDKMSRLEPKNERYCMEKDWQCLVWSAEHALWPMHMNEKIDAHDLPKRYIWYSSSFRREAWTYWKDMKWLVRLHQFDKVEMETFTTKEDWLEEHKFLVGIQEYFMRKLWIPYQVVICCTWDMWDPDARHIDVECRMPWMDRYLETHSADYMTDYQSRALNTKYRGPEWNWEYVYMNDATAFAIWRTLAAIIENNQEVDWSIVVPEALRPYTGFDKISL